MKTVAPYDEEGKEQVQAIAEYVLKFIDDDIDDLSMSHSVDEIVRSSVKECDYLIQEYGRKRTVRMVYDRMEEIRR